MEQVGTPLISPEQVKRSQDHQRPQRAEKQAQRAATGPGAKDARAKYKERKLKHDAHPMAATAAPSEPVLSDIRETTLSVDPATGERPSCPKPTVSAYHRPCSNYRVKAVRIGELATTCGCSAETIRYYERIGLLLKPARTANGYRHYDARHRQWLAFIRRCRRLGLSQDEVRRLLDVARQSDPSCARVEELMSLQIDQVRRKLRELKSMEKALVRLKNRCARGTLRDCPAIDELMS